MFDSHVHSMFSGDCEIKPEDMINKALSIGAKGLSFTDHVDLDYPECDEYFDIDYDEYRRYMDLKKDEFKNELIISKGVEVGLQPHILEDTKKVIDIIEPDFVIASIHCIDKLELHNGDFCKNKEKKQSYNRYFEEVYSILNKYNDYDIFGHFDIIRRYGEYKDKTINLSHYIDIIDEILKNIINNGKGIEVNTSGFRYNLESTLPGLDIIKRYKELGGEIITIGSDAHTEEYLFYKFDYVKYILNKVGFKYYSYYLNRNPYYIKVN